MSSKRRAQALLGTLVEIELQGPADVADPALQRAFARIAEVHAAMSFHEAGSDLRRIARCAAGMVLRVAPDTHSVLAVALRLEADSDAAFNPCCAAALVDRGLLPRPDLLPAGLATTLAEGIELLDDLHVRVRRPAWIDLGGIAKGYAVDAAVEALTAAGVAGGVVNAGGDLRCFGPQPMTVQLRDPRQPGIARAVAEISDLACATSAWRLGVAEHRTAHLVNPDRRVEDNPLMSVTVFAPRCVIADALTKVVWQRGRAASALLRAHQAQAMLWREQGEPLTL